MIEPDCAKPNVNIEGCKNYVIYIRDTLTLIETIFHTSWCWETILITIKVHAGSITQKYKKNSPVDETYPIKFYNRPKIKI